MAWRGEHQSAMSWHGLVTRAPRETRDEPWALLVGGGEWCSLMAAADHRPWQHHLAKPATLSLTEELHELRACRRSNTPCACIQRSADYASATLHFLGGGGMVRINDAWMTEEGSSIELAAGDVLELVCVHHPTVRHSSGWYTTTCHERDPKTSDLVSLVWRFVPQLSCIPMLSPTEDAKHFFIPCLPIEAEYMAASGDEQMPSRTRGSKKPRLAAVTIKLRTMDSLRIEAPKPPLLLLEDTLDYSWLAT